MKDKLKLYGSIFILIVFLPYLVTMYLHGRDMGFFSGRAGEDPQRETLVGLVAEEIPATCDLECLKAQAVIARTNLQSEPPESRAPGWSRADMQAAWGGDYYELYLERIESAVDETAGEILTCEGTPIRAAYHAVSNGHTRNAAEVPGQEAYGYLAGAESREDLLADHFLSICYMEKQQFADALRELFAGETVEAEMMPEGLVISERDSAGYVTKVTCGNTVANGEAVRQALGLNSACFYLSELEGQIRIVTKGIGHGLGFSQYGAEQMAKEGSDYTELLHYYYKDVKIEQAD